MVTQIVINYWAVIVAAIAHMIIGAFWYSPALFGGMWMKLSGLTSKDMEKAREKGMGKNYLVALVAALVMSYILAHFVKFLQISSIGEGIILALWIWLGFIVTVLINSVLWEGKSMKLYVLNIGYYLVSLIVASIILSVWY